MLLIGAIVVIVLAVLIFGGKKAGDVSRRASRHSVAGGGFSQGTRNAQSVPRKGVNPRNLPTKPSRDPLPQKEVDRLRDIILTEQVHRVTGYEPDNKKTGAARHKLWQHGHEPDSGSRP